MPAPVARVVGLNKFIHGEYKFMMVEVEFSFEIFIQDMFGRNNCKLRSPAAESEGLGYVEVGLKILFAPRF